MSAELMPAPQPLAAEAPPVSAVAAISPEARRIAGTILEVMAGVRSITDAALVLGVTAARYHQLEGRAVAGLIAACEPRAPGPHAGGGLPADLERLTAERDRLKNEVARYHTLLRISQEAFGSVAAPPASAPRSAALPGARQRPAARTASASAGTAKPRKPRKPSVRALRLAKRMQRADHGGSEGLPSAASTGAMPGATPAVVSGG